MATPKNLLLFKYGGNAMTDPELQKAILEQICSIGDENTAVVIVHGGGPFIKEALKAAKIVSEFVDGHRKTTPEAMRHVEMALKGRVNGDLVRIINALGYRAVGLSGKDGKTVTATKRWHKHVGPDGITQVDLGQVGDVAQVDTRLIRLLLSEGLIPVVTCIASSEEGEDFNINADMFAGHLAAALEAQEFLVLTDVDGLLEDRHNPSSLILELPTSQIKPLTEQGIIQGGMIPKLEACQLAIAQGAKAARIINGTKPEQLKQLHQRQGIGTLIKAD